MVKYFQWFLTFENGAKLLQITSIAIPETLMHVGLCGHKLQQVLILPYEKAILSNIKLRFPEIRISQLQKFLQKPLMGDQMKAWNTILS